MLPEETVWKCCKQFNDEYEWRLFGFETATILRTMSRQPGKMCQMTCCIGLLQRKYVAVLAKQKNKGSGRSFGTKACDVNAKTQSALFEITRDWDWNLSWYFNKILGKLASYSDVLFCVQIIFMVLSCPAWKFEFMNWKSSLRRQVHSSHFCWSKMAVYLL